MLANWIPDPSPALRRQPVAVHRPHAGRFVIGIFGHITRVKALVALGIAMIFLGTLVLPLMINLSKQVLTRPVTECGPWAATSRRAPQHEWVVPERYNIAADVCDKHPRDKLAMIHEHFDGDGARCTGASCRTCSNQAANVLRDHGVERGDRVALVLPPTPETAAALLRRPGSSGRSCSRCRCSTATTASAIA